MLQIIAALCVAALEATIVGMPLRALTPLDLPWLLLWVAVIAGWAGDNIAARVPERFERAVLVGGAVLAVVGFVALRLPISELRPGADQWPLAYTLALIALFLYWRGSRLNLRDSLLIATLVSRGALVFLASLILQPIFNPAIDSAPLISYVLGFMCVSLSALALVRALEAQTVNRQQPGWRWALVLGLAIGGVVILSVLVSALLSGGNALVVARTLIQAFLLPFALIGGAIAYLLLITIAEPLSRLIAAIFANLQLLPEAPPEADEAGEALGELPPFEAIERLADAATFLLALIPIVLLLIGILVLRQRRRPRTDDTEERESLGLAGNLSSDLRDLLSRLRNPFARRLEGLRAALAALAGDDPSIRVRRAYIRLLIALERREQVRPPQHTPAEFAATIATSSDAEQPVATITAAYEQARYNPAGASAADAAAADAALDALRKANPELLIKP